MRSPVLSTLPMVVSPRRPKKARRSGPVTSWRGCHSIHARLGTTGTCSAGTTPAVSTGSEYFWAVFLSNLEAFDGARFWPRAGPFVLFTIVKRFGWLFGWLVARLVIPVPKGGVSLSTQQPPKGPLQSLPLTLSIETETTVTACSKAIQGIWSAIPSSAGEEPSQVTHSGTGQRRLFSPTPCEPLTQSSQPCGALCTTSIEPMTKYQQAITGTEVPYLPTGPHVPVQSMLTSMPIQDPMRKTRARRPR
jgi:hypothetical protein